MTFTVNLLIIMYLFQVRRELLYYHHIMSKLGTENVPRGPVLKLQCICDFSETNFSKTDKYKEHFVEREYEPGTKLVNTLKKPAKYPECWHITAAIAGNTLGNPIFNRVKSVITLFEYTDVKQENRYFLMTHLWKTCFHKDKSKKKSKD